MNTLAATARLSAPEVRSVLHEKRKPHNLLHHSEVIKNRHQEEKKMTVGITPKTRISAEDLVVEKASSGEEGGSPKSEITPC